MGDAEFYLDFYEKRPEETIPWAVMAPREQLVTWLDRTAPAPGRAMVVACGFGDDAAELARRGWEVTAFDVSPIAVRRCRERFGDAGIDFSVQDLFALPDAWRGAYDLVVDVFTVQALSPGVRRDVVSVVGGLAAPGGQVFVHTVRRDDDVPVASLDGPPWPLSSDELALFEDLGLTRTSSVDTERDPASNLWRTTAVFTR